MAVIRFDRYDRIFPLCLDYFGFIIELSFGQVSHIFMTENVPRPIVIILAVTHTFGLEVNKNATLHNCCSTLRNINEKCHCSMAKFYKKLLKFSRTKLKCFSAFILSWCNAELNFNEGKFHNRLQFIPSRKRGKKKTNEIMSQALIWYIVIPAMDPSIKRRFNQCNFIRNVKMFPFEMKQTKTNATNRFIAIGFIAVRDEYSEHFNHIHMLKLCLFHENQMLSVD